MYRYHAAEQYQAPACALDVLEEELKLYPSGADLRLSMLGLIGKYGKTPLAQSINYASRLLFRANIQRGFTAVDGTNPSPYIDNEFYAGGILGMHTLVQTLPKHQRLWVYGTRIINIVSSPPETDEETRLQQAVDAMADFRASGWNEQFAVFPAEFQDKLYEAATQLYEQDYQNELAPDQLCMIKDTFLAGYAYTASKIGGAIELQPTSHGPM